MTTKRPNRKLGFTLIEIMVVCAIIGIVMTIAIPSVYRQLHPESMQKAVNDVLEACRDARAYAVLQDTTAELVIRPAERQFEVMQGRTSAPVEDMASPSVSGEEWRMPDRNEPGGGGTRVSSFKLSDRILIELIGLNGDNWTEDEVVRVRFYRDGTADKFNIVLASDKGEQRMIFTDVVTGLADVETEQQLQKYR